MVLNLFRLYLVVAQGEQDQPLIQNFVQISILMIPHIQQEGMTSLIVIHIVRLSGGEQGRVPSRSAIGLS